MARIPKNLGQAGSGVNSERGGDSGMRSLLLSILEDLTNLRQAAIDLDTAGTHGVTVPPLVTTSE